MIQQRTDIDQSIYFSVSRTEAPLHQVSGVAGESYCTTANNNS